MHICIDSSVFVRGFLYADPAVEMILDSVGRKFELVIPRLVAQEVTRNLASVDHIRRFYRVFRQFEFAFIIDESIPQSFVEKYVELGLPAKADAFIGAFAEWQQVDYLLSYNRHFLRQLRTPAFIVTTPNEFVGRFLA